MPKASGKVRLMRIKIPIPETEPQFRTQMTIQVGDLNYGDHLGNDRLLLLAHESRMRFLKSLGHSEASFFGRALIMTDSAVQYLSQGNWNDTIEIKVWLTPNNDMRFDLFYQLNHIDPETGEEKDLLSKIKTGLAFFDYEEQKITRCTKKYTHFIRGLHDL
jgi:acyl-CoA thioester hydrolase